MKIGRDYSTPKPFPMTRRLDWRRTFPGIERDYTAKVDGGFARVYFTDRGQTGGSWHWTASRSELIGNGFVSTPEEAIRLAEEALIRPTPPGPAAPQAG